LGVPVFLSAFHLDRPYYYNHRVCLIHMMLHSWAGSCVGATQALQTRPKAYLHDLEDLLGVLRQLGVTHRDVWEPNIFWCSETNSVMLIDFKRAILERLRPFIAKTSYPKRISSRNKYRRSKSEGDSSHLPPVVLNGGVHRMVAGCAARNKA
ncbi:hypothetical protein EDB81DRAFT_634197, partial [Dactylonectria macrodidyma]